MLGPDILAPELDEARVPAAPARGRPDAPDRRRAARPADRSPGSATCGRPRAASRPRIDPWRRTGDVSDEEALAIVRATRPRMQESARDGMQERFKVVYGIAGAPCPRCGEPSRSRRAGRATTTGRHTGVHDVSAEADRPQGRRPDRARATRPPRSTRRSPHGVDMIEFDVLEHEGPAAARARLRARRRRADARGGPRAPRVAARSTASSSTSTSSCTATRSARSTRCASTG